MNKASEGDGIPAELFQFLKDEAVKVFSMPVNLKKSGGLKHISFYSNPKERQFQ